MTVPGDVHYLCGIITNIQKMKIYRQEIRNFHGQKFTVVRTVFTEEEYENMLKAIDTIKESLREDGIDEENVKDTDFDKYIFIIDEYLREEVTRKEKYDDGSPTLTWTPEMMMNGITALIYILQLYSNSIIIGKQLEKIIENDKIIFKTDLLILFNMIVNKLYKSIETTEEKEYIDTLFNEVRDDYNRNRSPEYQIVDNLDKQKEG